MEDPFKKRRTGLFERSKTKTFPSMWISVNIHSLRTKSKEYKRWTSVACFASARAGRERRSKARLKPGRGLGRGQPLSSEIFPSTLRRRTNKNSGHVAHVTSTTTSFSPPHVNDGCFHAAYIEWYISMMHVCMIYLWPWSRQWSLILKNVCCM